jgi:NADH:ubiquinone oxidoreductase subunit 2 (subunit N)
VNPFLAATLSISVRSMAGIPPLGGFMAKRWVFFAAVSQSLILFSRWAVLTSCVGAFYYRRWIKLMYFEPRPQWPLRVRVDAMTATVMGICLGRMRSLLAFPGPLRLRTHRMALARCR